MNEELFYCDEGTPDGVKKVLERYYNDRTQRIRIFLGDKITGMDWENEYDIMGYVGRSTGSKPIALLVNNSRSLGGLGILTACIVKITANGFTKYQHPNYHYRKHEVQPSDLPEYREMVVREGEVQARFSKEGQAQRYIDFIEGRRNSK
jgi:hypothetical protein